MNHSSADSVGSSTRPLAAGAGEPAIVLNPGAPSPFLFLGDHAGREIPQALGDLGLAPGEIDRHIAWDIGIAGLGGLLAEALGACFIAQRYSRLVIDCNREPNRPDAIPAISDGAPIPANAGLTPADREARRDAIFSPYHDRIAEELEARSAAGLPTVVIALHSFTPVMAGIARPWVFGVLHQNNSPFSEATLRALRAEPDSPVVGDNEPYSMDDIDFTIPHHAVGRGLDYLELEVRQDLLGEAAGRQAVAARLARVLPQVLRMAAAT